MDGRAVALLRGGGSLVEAWRGLKEAGYVVGQNVAIEFRQRAAAYGSGLCEQGWRVCAPAPPVA
jgi:hypothetical protein